MQWFRQDSPLTLDEQLSFMKSNDRYEGYIILEGSKKVGVCAINHHNQALAELCIAAPLKYQKQAVRKLLTYLKDDVIVGAVFIDNPALKVYLNLGFVPYGVKERHYWKEEQGFVDTIWISYERPNN